MDGQAERERERERKGLSGSERQTGEEKEQDEERKRERNREKATRRLLKRQLTIAIHETGTRNPGYNHHNPSVLVTWTRRRQDAPRSHDKKPFILFSLTQQSNTHTHSLIYSI